MSALTPIAFEKELRDLCDKFFERPDLPYYPFAALCDGKLTKVQLKNFYIEQKWWDTSLIFSGTVLPLLLERCPDSAGRAQLWELIGPEFGSGELALSHAMLAKRFLQALGIPEHELPWTLAQSDQRRRVISEIESKSFIELLACNFLGPETVGPKVFGTFARMLQEQLGMSKDEVAFFDVHGEQDKADSDILLRLVASYAATSEDQEIVRRALAEHYERPRVRALCAIKPIKFRFNNQAD